MRLNTELKKLLVAASITLCADNCPSEQMRLQSHREEVASRDEREEVRELLKLLFSRWNLSGIFKLSET